MKNLTTRRQQRGITLTESLLVLALAALLASIAYTAYGNARKDARLTDATTGTIALVAKIDQLYGNTSDYSTLTAQLLAQTGLVPSQFQVVGDGSDTELRDLFGNTFTVEGGAGSYAFIFNNLDRESCSKVAPALSGIAYKINIGTVSDVTTSNGQVSGGQAYKNDFGDIDVGNLATGCNASPTRLAVEVRA